MRDSGESWYERLRGMTDEQLEDVVREMTEETLPSGDPMIPVVRAWLRGVRDELTETPRSSQS